MTPEELSRFIEQAGELHRELLIAQKVVSSAGEALSTRA